MVSIKITGIAPQPIPRGWLRRLEACQRRLKVQPVQQLHQSDHVAAVPAAMAIENIFAAIDIERGTAVVMQRAASKHLVPLAVSGGFPSLFFQVREQRNAPPQAVSLFCCHAELVSGSRIRRAAFPSQANRVGGSSQFPFRVTQRLTSRRANQRRTVEGSAERFPSALSGTHSSTARCGSRASCAACWRAIRL
jgi:hypothetical protein